MDMYEKSVVQQNFHYLVEEGKADELLDDLFSKCAIDLDDYQRVFKGQVTDSDKMRELLSILLKKTRLKHGNVFQTLLDAFTKAKRSDVAEALIQCYKSSRRRNDHQAMKCPISCRGNNSGFCFTPGTSSSTFSREDDGGNTESMDVAADCISNNSTSNDQTLTTTDSVVTDASPKLPDSVVTDASPKLPVITAEQVKKAVNLNHQGSAGKLSVGGRLFSFKKSGQYNNGKLKWNMKVTDEVTGRVVEKLSDTSSHELLESCLLSFT